MCLCLSVICPIITDCTRESQVFQFNVSLGIIILFLNGRSLLQLLKQLWRYSHSYEALMTKRVFLRRMTIFLREDFEEDPEGGITRRVLREEGWSEDEIEAKIAGREAKLKEYEKELEELVIKTRNMKKEEALGEVVY